MESGKTRFREYLEALLIAVIFASFARTFVVQAFKIPTGSMEENLLVGDHILVNKFIYGPTLTPLERWLLPHANPARGDVVVFKYPRDPQRDFIKRCVGLAGDRVSLVNKTLYLNGAEVNDESYTYHQDPRVHPSSPFLPEGIRARDNFPELTVPEGRLFCLGDNRDNSNDSRFWGPVPRGYVKGRAFMIYWSFASEGEPIGWPGLRGKVAQLGRVGRNFFSSTRWARTFRIVR